MAKPKPRPLHIAAADWANISLSIRMFAMPEIKVTETRVRKTVVAKKWLFFQRD